MKKQKNVCFALIGISMAFLILAAATAVFAEEKKVVSSYGPTNQDVPFETIKAQRLAVKAERAKEHTEMLDSRYDLSKKTSPGILMSGGKPVPLGPTARLNGVTWDEIGDLTPAAIKEKGLFPYKPLPFADHAEGGMLFPEMITKTLPILPASLKLNGLLVAGQSRYFRGKPRHFAAGPGFHCQRFGRV